MKLPFGRTQTDYTELRHLIDVDHAAEQAREGDVDEPERRVNQFVRHVPALLQWLEDSGRSYPWRQTTDPWKVYIAEILLQRTRGDAVAQVYLDFLDQFPDSETLHEATEEEIRETISSLGFVNHRTRTLQEIGQLFTERHHGSVPDDLDELMTPWRAGDYSARACQMFARGVPLALVDANFARVTGRVLGYDMPDQPHKSSDVYALLEALVPAEPALARAFNLAILDLGALICTAQDPDCKLCPLNEGCDYYQNRVENA